MIGKNEVIPINVLTQKGVKAIEDVDIGDIVFEYKTSRLLEVYDVNRYNIGPIYEVTYSDKRKEFYSVQDYIYTGYSIIPFIRLLRYPKETKLGIIKSYQTDFELPDEVRDELILDPYIVGALLMESSPIWFETKERSTVLSSPLAAASRFISSIAFAAPSFP